MSSRLPAFIKNYGFLNGLKLYRHIKSKSNAAIRLPGLQHPLYLRGKPDSTDAFIFEQIFIEKQYDVSIPLTPKFIIDLGANVGFASVLFANLYPNAKILAIEPDAGNYEAAKKNLAPYKNVTLIKGAVWHKSEMINLVDDGFGEAAFMIKPGQGSNMVQGYTIKELMEQLGTNHIDLLKMDVEGAEKELFEYDAKSWIPFTKMMLVETHDRYKKNSSTAVFQEMAHYDFSLELKGENMVLYNNLLINPYPKHNTND
ncbi:MAG: FkbM family methyltransferase [Ferruginibacter sp.]|nr:FkbM family methyltransferase [Ferruginibacter sp.]